MAIRRGADDASLHDVATASVGSCAPSSPAPPQASPRALPAPGRIAAGPLTAVLVGGLLALINGPWLRVARVAWAGERYTPASSWNVSSHRSTAPPCWRSTHRDGGEAAAPAGRLPRHRGGGAPRHVKVHLVEKVAAFVWQTSAVRLVGVSDGTLIGQIALNADLPADMAALPLIDDRRVESRNIIVGDLIDAITLAAALRLSRGRAGGAGLGRGSTSTCASPTTMASSWSRVACLAGRFWVLSGGRCGPAPQSLQRAGRRPGHGGPHALLVRGRGEDLWVDVRDPRRVYWRP